MDQPLFDKFRTEGSREAFAQIVEQYVPIVHAAAHRQLADADLAHDVTQAVFLLLWQKGRTLNPNRPLIAWLLKTTSFVAANARRENSRRQRREQRASTMRTHESPEQNAVWRELLPLLDDALTHLHGTDRDALLLRFFEAKTIRDTGTALGISGDAAEKRIARALQKLRRFFLRRGIPVGAAALTACLVNESTRAAPPGIAQTITAGVHVNAGAALAKGATMLMHAAQLKVAALITAVVLAAGTLAWTTVAWAAATPAPRAPFTAAVATTSAPASAAAITPYSIPGGEVLRVIRNPTPEARAAMWRQIRATYAAQGFSDDVLPAEVPAGPFAFDDNAGSPRNPVVYAPGQQLPVPRLIVVLSYAILHLEPYEIEISPGIQDRLFTIPGDVVYRTDVPAEKALPALAAALQKEANVSVKLSFQKVDREVYVLKGKWNFHRIDFQEALHPPEMDGKVVDPLLEIYGTDTFDPAAEAGGGVFVGQNETNEVAAKRLGDLVAGLSGDQQIIVEAEGIPGTFGWRSHPSPAGATEKTLTHIAEQTGLAWSREKRAVKRLVVEPK